MLCVSLDDVTICLSEIVSDVSFSTAFVANWFDRSYSEVGLSCC